jgi:predicted 3-demethylubiquinone-9 3-methyltransferase (glyoxalase superfamily)
MPAASHPDFIISAPVVFHDSIRPVAPQVVLSEMDNRVLFAASVHVLRCTHTIEWRFASMPAQIRTHMMFDGKAEEAMNFYVSLFPGSGVQQVIHYEEGENKGKILQATFSLSGKEFICIDTIAKHKFNFTPIISVFVDCESIEELERVYAALVEGGEALMPLNNYGFSQKFGWVKDRYGFSWQLNLPNT